MWIVTILQVAGGEELPIIPGLILLQLTHRTDLRFHLMVMRKMTFLVFSMEVMMLFVGDTPI